jgi:hypothetical protein
MPSKEKKLEAMRKRAKLGTGRRHELLSEELSHRKGVRDPKALAAVIGRRKYGAKKMATMAARGR